MGKACSFCAGGQDCCENFMYWESNSVELLCYSFTMFTADKSTATSANGFYVKILEKLFVDTVEQVL